MRFKISLTGVLLMAVGWFFFWLLYSLAAAIQDNLYVAPNETYDLYVALGRPLYLTSFVTPLTLGLVGLGLFLLPGYIEAMDEFRLSIIFIGVIYTLFELVQMLVPPYPDQWIADVLASWFALGILAIITRILKKMFPVSN